MRSDTKGIALAFIMNDSDTLPTDFIRECVLLGRKWRARVDERLKASDMTLSRFTVLYWVDALPEGASQREIADTVGIEGPTLVRQLHALEAQGLIERVPLENDRRAKCIQLTAGGRAKLEELNDVGMSVAEDYLGKLERRRLPSAIRLAKQAREALS